MLNTRSLSASKFDSPLLIFIAVCSLINLTLLVQMLVSSSVWEEYDGSTGISTCEYDSGTKQKVALYSVLDSLIGTFFLGIFLRPLFANRRSLMRQQSDEAVGAAISAQILNKMIKNNLAGALLSQFAQTTALVLSALTEYQVRVHAIRLTTCLNLLGISVMLRDTGKFWELVNTKMLSIAVRTRRKIYVVAINAESKDLNLPEG
mmetsp:Transcript_879/g.1291  ORF Transcript_879/g.1291 Transcript_879/m.1291 type:complete len:205 (-) Transcript_879:86-700(-)